MNRSQPRIGAPAGLASARDYEREVADAIEAFQAASARLSSIDAITTELVRLRSARYHDCHR